MNFFYFWKKWVSRRSEIELLQKACKRLWNWSALGGSYYDHGGISPQNSGSWLVIMCWMQGETLWNDWYLATTGQNCSKLRHRIGGNRGNRQKCKFWGTLKTVSSHMFIDFLGVFYGFLTAKTTLNPFYSFMSPNSYSKYRYNIRKITKKWAKIHENQKIDKNDNQH